MRQIIFTILLLLPACHGEFITETSPLEGTDTDTYSNTEGDAGHTSSSSGDPTQAEGSGSGDFSTSTSNSQTGTGETGTPKRCGDGIAEGLDEECDGFDLRGLKCTDLQSPIGTNFHGGQLACDDTCILDVSSCTWCGDGQVNHVTESCDAEVPETETCESQGYDAGELACDASCMIDVSGCESCEVPADSIYGNPFTEAQGCSATVSSSGGEQWGVCTTLCENVTDCQIPNIDLCEVVPTCAYDHCYLDCSNGQQCPDPMVCTGIAGTTEVPKFCMWPD